MFKIFIKRFILLAIVVVFPARAEQSNVIAAYYENYAHYRPPSGNRPPFSLDMIDADLITDLYYAFAGCGYVTKSIDPANPHLTGDYTIQPMEKEDESVFYPQALKLKQNAKGVLRLFLSVGGWNFNNPKDPEGTGAFTFRLFSQMVSTASNRKQFIDSAVAYLHRFSFDGLDIDWEYPGDLTRGGSVEDLANFILFLKECKAAFHAAAPPLNLSYSAPAFVPSGLPQEFQEDPKKYYRWLAQCAPHLDRINVMAYDYHGPFADPKITGANSPLNRDSSPKSPYYIANTLDNYLDNGVPGEKIILAMPAFGHSYAGVADLTVENAGPGKPFKGPGTKGPSTEHAGLLAYYEIADMVSRKELIRETDYVTSTAYGYNSAAKAWVSFDTPETIKLKAELARKRNLKGIALWAIDLDEYHWEPKFPNLRSASDVFR